MGTFERSKTKTHFNSLKRLVGVTALAALAVKLLAVAQATAAGGGTPLDLLARVPASVGRPGGGPAGVRGAQDPAAPPAGRPLGHPGRGQPGAVRRLRDPRRQGRGGRGPAAGGRVPARRPGRPPGRRLGAVPRLGLGLPQGRPGRRVRPGRARPRVGAGPAGGPGAGRVAARVGPPAGPGGGGRAGGALGPAPVPAGVRGRRPAAARPLALAPAWSPRDLVWPAVFGYLGDARWASIYAVAAGATVGWTSTWWGGGRPWAAGVAPGTVPDGTVAGLGLITWVVLASWLFLGWRTVAVEAGAVREGAVDSQASPSRGWATLPVGAPDTAGSGSRPPASGGSSSGVPASSGSVSLPK